MDSLSKNSKKYVMTTTDLDDGSTLIEWIFKEFRLGISLEVNPTDSNYYLVSNERLGDTMLGGSLFNPTIKKEFKKLCEKNKE